MRIGLVHPYVWPEVQRGGERYLDDLTTYLVGAGHDVDVISSAESTYAESVDGLTIRRRRRRARRLGRRFGLNDVDVFGLATWPALVRHRYDVVQALVPSGAIAARLAGQRTIFSSIGFLTPGFPQQRNRRQILDAAIRASHAVTAMSAEAAKALERLKHRPAEPLWPGVWLDRFPHAPEPRSGPPVLLYPSDLSVHRKGLDVLLAAVARLLPQRPDIRVRLSGAGDPGWAFATLSDQDRRAVDAVTERAGLADTDELIRRYQAATVTVLPAKEEAFGIILVESLACGTPVVACTGSGMTEIVEDPASGRLAQYGDVDDLARALEDTITLAADPATPARCRQAATRFSWADRIGPVHEDLYRRVARSSRRHAT